MTNSTLGTNKLTRIINITNQFVVFNYIHEMEEHVISHR